MESFINQQGNLITDQEEIIENCLNEIGRFSLRKTLTISFKEFFDVSQFPELPPLQKDEMIYIKEKFNKNKGIAYDGFSDL